MQPMIAYLKEAADKRGTLSLKEEDGSDDDSDSDGAIDSDDDGRQPLARTSDDDSSEDDDDGDVDEADDGDGGAADSGDEPEARRTLAGGRASPTFALLFRQLTHVLRACTPHAGQG